MYFQGIVDMFPFVLFYVFFFFITITFALHLFSDVEAKYPKGGYQPFSAKQHKSLTNQVDEKTPLLSDQTDPEQATAKGGPSDQIHEDRKSKKVNFDWNLQKSRFPKLV